MAKKAKQPGDLYNALQQKRMKKIKTSGSFGGKSNKLGHGGRATQWRKMALVQ